MRNQKSSQRSNNLMFKDVKSLLLTTYLLTLCKLFIINIGKNITLTSKYKQLTYIYLVFFLNYCINKCEKKE